MITALAYLIYAAIVLTFAEQCAKWDAEEIAYRIEHGGESLDHAPMWKFRAGVVGLLAITVWCIAGIEAGDTSMLNLLPLLGFGAFAFSALFRYRLNGRRGLDWRYVSPSSRYDWQFIRWTPFFRGPNSVGGEVSAAFMGRVYAINEHLQASIHRAGTIAYITELTITAACIVWVALTL